MTHNQSARPMVTTAPCSSPWPINQTTAFSNN